MRIAQPKHTSSKGFTRLRTHSTFCQSSPVSTRYSSANYLTNVLVHASSTLYTTGETSRQRACPPARVAPHRPSRPAYVPRISYSLYNCIVWDWKHWFSMTSLIASSACHPFLRSLHWSPVDWWDCLQRLETDHLSSFSTLSSRSTCHCLDTWSCCIFMMMINCHMYRIALVLLTISHEFVRRHTHGHSDVETELGDYNCNDQLRSLCYGWRTLLKIEHLKNADDQPPDLELQVTHILSQPMFASPVGIIFAAPRAIGCLTFQDVPF